ncbi:hypothetical protein GGI23_000325 [Coemansia sp. RSA 2559]|nr:hypothetical protein GGI23_000325 [Coemansia sp. RSA 2559]KAJ2868762.1 hypothetical protein GGI22_000654 [Coemansia erecta]
MHTKFIGIILALAAIALAVVQAHTQVFNAGVNGVLGANFQYRIEDNFGNVPITDLSSPDLRCRSTAAITGIGVDKLSINAGETLTFKWNHANNSVVLPVLPRSHKGPCMAYMAPLSSQGAGPVWFKIYEEGYDIQAKLWCTDKIINAWGIMNVVVPKNIPDGDYLVRAEVLALHQTVVVGSTQFYPNCFVLTVRNGQGPSMPKGYLIPGIYDYHDPGILYGRNGNLVDYQVPGPPVFT